MKHLMILILVPLILGWSSSPPDGWEDYNPQIKEYPYSVEGVAAAIHDDTAVTVTLRDRETLRSAGARLKVKSKGFGGVLLVPWDVKTVACDDYYHKRNKVDNFTLRGVLGPDGQAPRFYCRRQKMGGIIPKEMGGIFMQGGATHSTLVENIHVEGYTKWWSMASAPHVVVRNNLFEGATNDGFTSGNIEFDDPTMVSRLYEFAGNEISHAGQGNTSHCLYMHRSQKEHLGVTVTLKFIDNNVHSCNWSSGVKTIANINLISGNTFTKYRDTGNNPRRYMNMVIDVAACSHTVIENNAFNIHSPLDDNSPNVAILGSRDRRSIFGCDVPPAWNGNRVRLENGDKHNCARNPTVPECMLPDSNFWKPAFWLAKRGEKEFKTIFRNNTIRVTGKKNDKATIVLAEGTYPNYTWRLGGWDCPLEVPDLWYDRSMVYISGNTYFGVTQNEKTFMVQPSGWGHPTLCPTPSPDRDLREWDLYEIGEGETYHLTGSE